MMPSKSTSFLICWEYNLDLDCLDGDVGDVIHKWRIKVCSGLLYYRSLISLKLSTQGKRENPVFLRRIYQSYLWGFESSVLSIILKRRSKIVLKLPLPWFFSLMRFLFFLGRIQSLGFLKRNPSDVVIKASWCVISVLQWRHLCCFRLFFCLYLMEFSSRLDLKQASNIF